MKLWKHFIFFLQKSPEANSSKKKQSTLGIYVSFFQFANISERLGIISAMILAIGVAVCQPYYLFLSAVIADDYVKETKYKEHPETMQTYSEEIFKSNVYKSSILIVELGVVTLICLYLAGGIFSYITSKQVFKMRREIFKKILMQDMTWYDLNQTGDFASLLSDNFAKIEDGLGEKLIFFLYDQAVFITCILWSLIIGWSMTLVGLIFLPVLMIVTSAIPRLSRKLSKRASDAYSKASTIAEEACRSIRTVVTFNGQNKEIARYEKPLEDAKRNNIKNSISTGLKNATLWFFRFSGTSISWWYGFQLVLESNHSLSGNNVYLPSKLMTVCTNISVGCFYYTMGCVYLEVFGMACGAAENIFEILNFKNESVSNLEGEIKLQNPTGSIVFDDVFFKYPSREDVDVLKGISIKIEPGETVAFVGQSGSGKSTCIQLLERFYDPYAGKICIDDIDIRDLDISWMRRNIGLVSQEAVLFAGTITENIRFGKMSATQAEIEKAAEKAHIHSFINSLPKSYETVIGERGMQLSGGQKQRIALARALIRKPSILLLDEATSALDSVSEAEVQAALESVSGNCTTIVVAHRLSTIKNADQIFVFSKGEVVEQGTYLQLMEMKNHFFKLRQKQSSYNSLEREDGTTPHIMNFQTDLEIIERDESHEELSHTIEKNEENDGNFPLDILRMSKPEWKLIILGILASIGVGSSLCLYAMTYSNILWSFSMQDETIMKHTVLLNCIYNVCLGVGAGLSYILQCYAFGVVGENLLIRLRTKMFATILDQDMEWFDKKENGIGALCGRISSDANAIQGFGVVFWNGRVSEEFPEGSRTCRPTRVEMSYFLSLMTGLAAGTFMCFISCAILCFGFALYNQWRLCLVLTGYPVILMISVALQQKYTEKFIAFKEEKLLETSKFAMEAINNIRTVKAFGAEDFFLRQYTEQLVSYIKLSRRISYTRSIVLGISSSLNLFHFATGYIYGAVLVSKNIDNYAQLFKVDVLMFNATWALGNIVSFISNFQNGIRGGKSIQKLFMTQPKLNNLSNNFNETWDNGNIEYKKVSFSYPTRPASTVLKNLNLSIQSGKTIALVGATGSGKSSIIQLLQRFYDSTSGQIEIDNNNIKQLNLERHRVNFGVVSQEPNLFDRSIAENIAYGDNSRSVAMEEIIEAAKNANIHNFITSLPQGYDTLLGVGGAQISGGQKQRIAIARALLRNPKILILDEATSALDNENERIVQEALDKAKEGRTCITIAHRLSTIQKADLIYVIDKGEVVELGNHEKLMNMCGYYHQLNRF